MSTPSTASTFGNIRPQAKLLLSWRIHLAILMVIPALCNALFFLRQGRWFVIISAIWILLFLALYLFYLPLRYTRLSYAVSDDQVCRYSGVFYTRLRSFPMQNIQFTTINRSPLDHLFGMCTLIVTAAGGRLMLPGLLPQEAEELSKILLDVE